MNRAVFIDRDGVLIPTEISNGRPIPLNCVEAVSPFEGVAEALVSLKKLGFLTVMVTNQPDVARQITPKYVVEAMNRKLSDMLALDHCYTCFHDDDDGCKCRKPLPGMLLAASIDHRIDLRQSYMIGDRWRDIDAGVSAGCTTIWIESRYDEMPPKAPDYSVNSLFEAAKRISEIEGTERK